MDLQALYDRLPRWGQSGAMQAYALRTHVERYGPRFERVLAGLLQSERWSPQQLQADQDERLRALIRHAYQHVPYYREVMDARRLRPEDVQCAGDLAKLPLLTRETVRDRARDLLATNLRSWQRYHGHTSGTTGSPLSFSWDRPTCIVNNAVDWRQKLWAGLDRESWYAVVLGRRVVATEQAEPPYWRANYLHRQLWLSAFHLSDDALPAYFDAMAKRGCPALEGYPSTCYILASHLLRSGRTFPLRCVLTSSETLHPIQRETIARAFECEVFDFYGLAERVIFAGECEAHTGRHLNSEFGITELVDRDGRPVPPGESGLLVGTSLHNRAMPFIRYATSDVSRFLPDACPCGRSLPRMDAVATKAEDIVVTPDGRYVSPSTLTHPFKPLTSIRRSQIHQTALDRLAVKLVPAGRISRDETDQLVAGLRERLGDGVEIRVEIVEEIPPEPSGKFRWVRSDVAKTRSDLALWEDA